MALKLVLLVALGVVLTVEGLPRYFAVPLKDIKLVRHVRSASPRDLPAYREYRPSTYDYIPSQSNRRPVYLQPAPEILIPASSQNSPVFVDNELVPESSDRYERENAGYGGGNDHVDYGAYTGSYGAFGWYSDHPVCTNCGYHHRRR